MPDPSPVGLCDTHAHLSLVAERKGQAFMAGLLESYSGGSALIVDPGVDYDDFPRRKAAFGGLGFVRLAAGIWPDAESLAAVDERAAALEGYARDEECRAIGECGLDYYWMNGTEAQQEALFRAQAELAVRYSKPLIVHSRSAYGATLAIVEDYSSKVPVIIHCFGYDEAAALRFVAAGCWVSFAGNLSYKRSDDLRAACAAVPDSFLLLETDAPYMCPEPLRGKDSSPLDIGRTYELAAGLRGSDPGALSRLVERNARGLFS